MTILTVLMINKSMVPKINKLAAEKITSIRIENKLVGEEITTQIQRINKLAAEKMS